MVNWHRLDSTELMEELQTTADGISESEAKAGLLVLPNFFMR